ITIPEHSLNKVNFLNESRAIPFVFRFRKIQYVYVSRACRKIVEIIIN
ncbi:conserved domain protein, partial [Bacteroides fluxus YIT 12057]